MKSDIAAGRAELFSFMTELQWNNNRDVRFSRDKSPYKTGMGALFGVGGLWDPDGPTLAAVVP